MQVKIGEHELAMDGPYLGRMREANDLLNDPAALRTRLDEDGYLLIRGFHDSAAVGAARQELLQKLAEMGRLAPQTALETALVGPANRSEFFGEGGAAGLATWLSLFELLRSPGVMAFFERLLGGPVAGYDYQWGRATGRDGFSAFHYDNIFMGRGTPNLYTVWTPLGDVPLSQGPLVVLTGQPRLERLRQTYGQLDVDRDRVEDPYFNDPFELVDRFGGRWVTSDFEAGDAVIFGMFLMHGSLSNTTDHYRLSVDARYQLVADAWDERWVGPNPPGHYAWHSGPTVKMASLRQGWQL